MSAAMPIEGGNSQLQLQYRSLAHGWRGWLAACMPPPPQILGGGLTFTVELYLGVVKGHWKNSLKIVEGATAVVGTLASIPN